jgi:hypothetical protein
MLDIPSFMSLASISLSCSCLLNMNNEMTNEAVNIANKIAMIMFKHSVPHNLHTFTSGGGTGIGHASTQSLM